MVPTDESTDQKATEGAQKQLDQDYNVLSANCVDVCSDALKNAGLDPGYTKQTVVSAGTGAPGFVAPTTSKILTPIPNIRYDNIVRNNPGGTDVSNILIRKK